MGTIPTNTRSRKMRDFTAKLISPILVITGFRFSKAWRQADTGFLAFVFANLLNTTLANICANFIVEA
jgi:hypothetical protein